VLQVRRREELRGVIPLQLLEEATLVAEVLGETVVAEEGIQEEEVVEEGEGIRYQYPLLVECAFPR